MNWIVGWKCSRTPDQPHISHSPAPKWTEFAITAAIIAAGFFLFAMAVKYLPIFPEHGHGEATPATHTEAPVFAKAPAMSHAND